MDGLEAALTADAIDELVDAQLAKRPRPEFNCHKCGLVDSTSTCSDPYPNCPKMFGLNTTHQ